MFKDMKPATLYAISGFLMAVVLGGGSLISILMYPEWNIGTNSFSDLGSAESPSKVFFNTICIISGVFLFIFSIGYLRYGRKLARIGGLILLVDSVVLVLVGAISKEVSFDLHLLVSMLFASLFLAGAAFVCVQDVIDGYWRYIVPTAIAGLCVGIIWALYLMLGEATIPYGVAQIVSFGAAFVWFLSATYKNLKIGIGKDIEVTA